MLSRSDASVAISDTDATGWQKQTTLHFGMMTTNNYN